VTFEPSPAVAPQHVVDLDVVAAAGSLARLSRRVSAKRFSTARRRRCLLPKCQGIEPRLMPDSSAMSANVVCR
jgi:hypothetical protein